MPNYILGLDIGVNSIGWATLKEENGTPRGLIAAGVRIFTEGVTEGFEKGRDESRNAARRIARQRRVLLLRRARRMINILRALQESGLMPGGDVSTPQGRHQMMTDLDRSLFKKEAGTQGPLYRLRSKALDDELQPFEIGRAIYHLGHRRGFQSNRKSAPKKNEESGEVASEIADLRRRVQQSGARTLGEFFSRLDTAAERIRDRWTHREMCREEFEKIWAAQSPHHPGLMTETNKKNLSRAIFSQRPLKSMAGRIGECAFERGHKRAPWPILAAQRFRLLQKVNDLRLVVAATGEERGLTETERDLTLAVLENEGDRTFHQLAKTLGFRRGEVQFNLGSDEEENKIPGNRTAAKMRGVFGNAWDKWPVEKRSQAIEDWLTINDDAALEKRGRIHWGLTPEKAHQYAALNLEPGYCALSRKALLKITPPLEAGKTFAAARKETWEEGTVQQRLPHLPTMDIAEKEGWMPLVRNPAVRRVLGELRKVVNALVRRDGTPGAIRIELARDLKHSRKDRKEIWKRNETNRKGRERARMCLEENDVRPTGDAIERWLLAEECEWRCPYTNARIDLKTLFSGEAAFDVEHIVPFSRCLDDSFLNKTLCEANENRTRKKNRTPWEAYGDTARWDGIVARVANFKGEAAEAKKRRFLLKEFKEADFTSRQLNDTRYASRLAVQYIGLLYGAGSDGITDGRRVVQVGQGQITKYVRDEFNLNGILNDGGQKTRNDHRHHAVDALAIAVTDAALVKRLSDAASRAATERRRRFGKMDPPWPAFSSDAQAKILSVIPSHQPKRKISGPLHEETHYSNSQTDSEGRACVHHRKAVDTLSPAEVKEIVDPGVRKAVEDALQGRIPRESFKSPETHPRLKTRDGGTVPIHSVRIRVYDKTENIGTSATPRHVMTGSNHHVEILESRDENGPIKWEGKVVTRLDALRRLRRGEPVIRRDHGPGKKFIFSLCGGDLIKAMENGSDRLYVMRGLGYMRQAGREYVNLTMTSINDARLVKEIKASGEWKTALMEPLRKMAARKIVVTPLGDIRDAND